MKLEKFVQTRVGDGGGGDSPLKGIRVRDISIEIFMRCLFLAVFDRFSYLFCYFIVLLIFLTYI